jgi:ribosomal protein S18 acetylase RimI-like enzyme
MSITNTIRILYAREVSPELASDLRAIELASPTRAEVVERTAPRDSVDFATQHFLRPDDAVIVASAGSNTVVGYALSKLRRAAFDGEPATVNYLAGIRVHPDHRRQGIGTSLLRACLSFGDQSEVVAHWAAVEPNNQPSLASLLKAGFAPARPIKAAGFPIAYLARMRSPRGLTCRSAGPDDADEAADLLNGFYEGYNFWSQLSGKDLWRVAGRSTDSPGSYDPEDLLVVRDASTKLRAVALVYDQARLESRVVEEILTPIGRVLDQVRPLIALSPVREAIPEVGRDFPKLFLHYFAATDRDAAYSLLLGVAQEWVRRSKEWSAERRPVMAVCQDQTGILGVRPGLLGGCRFILGMGACPSHLQVLVWASRQFDPSRPWWLNFWT